ncbi:MAG TPA: hypothetical protein VN739_03935 [Nitrososphaerales archaeon]|nr:hypothetical protein [Nitrososphaerales archaeon]
MGVESSEAILTSNQEIEVVTAFCQNCGKKITLTSSIQRFCSAVCKDDFDKRIGHVRRAKRKLYQREFRRNKYKTEAKHVMKISCPKCGEIGYLVKYSVKNKESGKVVSSYESVRHQITRDGRSVLSGQCYIRSLTTEV